MTSRAAVAARIRDKLQAAPWDGVTVWRGNRREQPREWVEVIRNRGEIDIRTSCMQIDDEWTVHVLVMTSVPGRSIEEAEARVELLANIAMQALTADPTLADPTPIPGLIQCVPTGAMEGPDAQELDPPGSGWGARIIFAVSCQTRP